MSDGFQILGFDTVPASEASNVLETALDWMKAQSFIENTATECVYSEDSLGYRPGSRWKEVVDGARRWRGLGSPGEYVPPPRYDMGQFLKLTIKGVCAEAGHIVCAGGSNVTAFSTGFCPACGADVKPQNDIVELASAWFERRNSDLSCPVCATTSRLEDWDFQPFWAFAEASLTFWNWPSLSQQFTLDLVSRLSLPRVRHIVGRL